MAKQVEENVNTKGGKKNRFVLAGIAAVILLIAGVSFGMLRSKEASSSPKRDVVVNQNNVEKVVADLEEKEPVRSGFYEVTMNTSWTFSDSKSASENAYVENIGTNTNDVYFDIHRADTNELIYSSPVLPLGSYLEDITLDTELSAGTYDCVMTYHLIDEEQKTLSTLKVQLAIIIEN